MIKQIRVLFWLILLLGMSACSEIIKIELIPTPTPTSVVELPQISAKPETVSAADVPSRIVVDTIDLDAPVIEMGWRLEEEGGRIVSKWNTPENEAGWHLNSARPGQDSNVVISGHNNSTGGHVFGSLEDLAVGDEIVLWTGVGNSFLYQVSEKQIIQAFGASQENLNYLQTVIKPTTEEQLTLITCWPDWTNTHRLIVVARPL